MDPLQRADGVLRDLRLRFPTVTVPSSASSPMDDRLTVKIDQDFINSCEPTESAAISAGFLDDLALAELDRAAAADRLDAEVFLGAVEPVEVAHRRRWAG